MRHTDHRGCFHPKGNTFTEPAKNNCYCRGQAGWVQYQCSYWSWLGHRGLQHSPFQKAKTTRTWCTDKDWRFSKVQLLAFPHQKSNNTDSRKSSIAAHGIGSLAPQLQLTYFLVQIPFRGYKDITAKAMGNLVKEMEL